MDCGHFGAVLRLQAGGDLAGLAVFHDLFGHCLRCAYVFVVEEQVVEIELFAERLVDDFGTDRVLVKHHEEFLETI